MTQEKLELSEIRKAAARMSKGVDSAAVGLRAIGVTAEGAARAFQSAQPMPDAWRLGKDVPHVWRTYPERRMTV